MLYQENILTSTHNVCFESKIRKLGTPMQTAVFPYIKVGFKVVNISRTCYSDDFMYNRNLRHGSVMDSVFT